MPPYCGRPMAVGCRTENHNKHLDKRWIDATPQQYRSFAQQSDQVALAITPMPGSELIA